MLRNDIKEIAERYFSGLNGVNKRNDGTYYLDGVGTQATVDFEKPEGIEIQVHRGKSAKRPSDIIVLNEGGLHETMDVLFGLRNTIYPIEM